MRFYDRLRWKLGLASVPIIDASAIADAIDALPTAVPRYPSASYGVVAPPFNAFFVEATAYDESDTLLGQRGVLVRATTDKLHPATPDRTRWTLTLEAFMYIKGQGIYGYQQLAAVFLDRHGKIINDMLKGVPLLPNPTRYERIGQTPTPGATLHCVYALKAINAMHQSCPAEHLTPTDEERQQYQRKAGAGMEPSDYYLLKVRPTVKVGLKRLVMGKPLSRAVPMACVATSNITTQSVHSLVAQDNMACSGFRRMSGVMPSEEPLKKAIRWSDVASD